MNTFRLPLLIAIIMLITIAFPPSALAAPWYAPVPLVVDTTADNAALSGCLAAVPGDCSLRGAIIHANSNPGTQFGILIPAGDYYLTIPGAVEDFSLTGDLDIRTSVVLRGDGPLQTRVIASQINDRVFHVLRDNTKVNVIFKDLSMSDGTAADGGDLLVEDKNTVHIENVYILDGEADVGAGLSNNGGSLMISSSLFAGNRSAINGGGLYNRNKGKVAISNTEFNDNEAVFNGAGLLNASGTMTVSESLFRYNFSTNTTQGRGGGLANAGSATMTLNTVIVELNRADGSMYGGGGIYNRGKLTIREQSLIRWNEVPNGGSGGGILSDGGNVKIRNSTVSGNQTNKSGGGITNFAPSTMSLVGVLVNLNQALFAYPGYGGGLYNTGTMDIANSVISENILEAGYGGGAANCDDGQMTVAGSVIMDNQILPSGHGSTGAGIANCGDFDSSHSLILSDTRVLRNTNNALAGYGGGVGSFEGSLSILDGSVIAENEISYPGLLINDSTARGAGVFAESGNLLIQNSSIIENTAGEALEFSVGGLHSGYNSPATIEGTTIRGNTASEADFSIGGIDASSSDTSIIILSSVIADNSALGTGRVVIGGVWSSGSSETLIQSSTIVNNFADSSPVWPYSTSVGGILVDGSHVFSLEGSIIAFNEGDIGGIQQSGSDAVINSSTIRSNVGRLDGGGMHIDIGTERMTIQDSTIALNTAENGGGLYIGDEYANISIINSTISGNAATAQGGGLYSDYAWYGNAYMNNVTFVNNTAAGAPNAIDIDDGSITFRNSLISDTPLAVNPIHCVLSGGTVSSVGYNLESGTSCGFTQPGDIQNSTSPVNPLADNGGPTETHALPAGHDAIDAGDPAGCYADLDGDGTAETLLTTDQRGNPRPIDGDGDSIPICDIGAYEYP